MPFWLINPSISIPSTLKNTWKDSFNKLEAHFTRTLSLTPKRKTDSGSQSTDWIKRKALLLKQERFWSLFQSYQRLQLKSRLRDQQDPNQTLTHTVHLLREELSSHWTHSRCSHRWSDLLWEERSTASSAQLLAPSCAPWWLQWSSQTLSPRLSLDEDEKS